MEWAAAHRSRSHTNRAACQATANVHHIGGTARKGALHRARAAARAFRSLAATIAQDSSTACDAHVCSICACDAHVFDMRMRMCSRSDDQSEQGH